MIKRTYRTLLIGLSLIIYLCHILRANSSISDSLSHQHSEDRALSCTPPTIPSVGNNIWSVSCFEGVDNFSPSNFKGYYTTDFHNKTVLNEVTTEYFKTSSQGWSPHQSPSDALASKGGATDYIGCPLPVDGFSIRAQRKGFPCGFYAIVLKNNNANDRFILKIDREGDGTFEEIFSCVACNGTFIAGNFLGPTSQIEIDAYNINGDFDLNIEFDRVKIRSMAIPTSATICVGQSTKLMVAGSENYTWSPSNTVSVIEGKLMKAFPKVSTKYEVKSSVAGCKDTVYVQVNVIPDTIQKDSFACTPNLPSPIIKNYKNYLGCDSIEVINFKSTRRDTIFLPVASRCNPNDLASTYQVYKNSVGCDSFVIQRYKLAPADTTFQDSTVNSCLVPNLNKIEKKFKNKSGCDSIVVYTLKPTHLDTTFLPVQVRCHSKDTARQFQVLKNSIGCDSVIVQSFSLAALDTIRRDSFICPPLSKTYMERRSTTTQGCEVIEIINFKPLKADTTFLPILSCCNPIDTIRQFTTLKNLNGCDSILVQTFKLSVADTTRRDTFVCSSILIQPIIRNFKNKRGCDSVEVLNIKVLTADTTFLNVLTRCNPKDTVTQYQFAKNQYGCDSITVQRFRLSSIDTLRRDSFACPPLSKTYIERRSTTTQGCEIFEIITIKALKSDTTYLPILNKCMPFDTTPITTYFKNKNGCDSIVIQKFNTIPNKLNFNITIDNVLSCANSSDGIISIRNIIGGLPPFKTTWNTGQNTPKLGQLKAGTYQATVIDSLGCQSEKSISLIAPSPFDVFHTVKNVLCFGESNGSISIDTIVGGHSPYNIQFGNGTDVYVNKFPFKISFLHAARYQLTVIDKEGCTQKETIEVKEPDKAEISFESSAIKIRLGDSIMLKPSFNFTPISWQWSPRSFMHCDTCLNPIITPTISTIYHLSAVDKNGCKAINSIELEVDKPRHIFVPNSFTPNGDGQNDYFSIFTDFTVQKIENLEIYNRWGIKVYERKDFLPNNEMEGWDGTFNGTGVNPDVYVYHFKVTYKDGKEDIIHGDFTVFR